MNQGILVFIIISLLLCSCTTIKTLPSLRDVALEWEKSMELKNADLITAAFDTNIIAIYHSKPAVYGKEANYKIWQSQFNDSLDQHPISIEKIDVSNSGEMGYVFGKWWSIHPTVNYYNGGRFFSIWKLINHKWQIVMLSVNIQEDVKAERQLNTENEK